MIKKEFLKLVNKNKNYNIITDKNEKHYYIMYGSIILEKIKITKKFDIMKIKKKIAKYSSWEKEYIYLKTHTSRDVIKNALHKLWSWSPERRTVLKRDNNSCIKCGKKSHKAKHGEVEFKINVHHKNGINWDKIIEVLREELFVEPEYLETLCKGCHLEEHKGE